MNKIKKLISIILIILVLICNCFFMAGDSVASTSSELNAKQKDLDAQIKEKKAEMNGVKKQMTSTLSQIDDLNQDIGTYEIEISNLQTQIEGLNTQINEKQTVIDSLEADYLVKKEALEKRLVAMYEMGGTSYLEMLLSADGLTDFLSKYYLISQIAEYDNDMVQNVVDSKNHISSEKEILETAKNEVSTSKTEVEGKKQSLASSVNAKKNLVSTLSAEEKAIQEEMDELEEDKKAVQRELAAIAARNKGNYTKIVEPSAAGYGTPLAGRTKANITTGYGAYRGHTGADFACASGTPILAVKSGTVVTSKARTNSRGQYISYGNYVVIDHHDGTMTLYAHMSSRAASNGQSVAQGDVIGYVGSTGNSTGPHLHFEVRINGSPVNPSPYLP